MDKYLYGLFACETFAVYSHSFYNLCEENENNLLSTK